MLSTFLLPLAVELLRSYLNNSSSKKDDLILQVIKDGAKYLSQKDNNNLLPIDYISLDKSTMKNQTKNGAKI
jgi:hypothetical protein